LEKNWPHGLNAEILFLGGIQETLKRIYPKILNKKEP
jgi:hypothetical protein